MDRSFNMQITISTPALTSEEKALVFSLGELHDSFKALPPTSPQDEAEFVHHIRAMQRIILSRPAIRELASKFELDALPAL